MANTYTLISSVTVGSGGAASMTFSSISANYTDLKLIISGRSDVAAVSRSQIYLQFNTDTGSNYSYRRILGYDSNSTLSDTFTGTPSAAAFIAIPAAAATATTFGNTEIYIPNYLSSNQKSYSVDIASENNSATAWLLGLSAALWANTAAINQIIITTSSGNLVQYSTAYLYGISNA